MRTGRPKKRLTLTKQDKEKLELIARRPKTSQRAAQRARIVLACARGLGNTEVAQQVKVNVATVGKWRTRFIAQGLASLGDAPRSGAPRQMTDRQVEAVGHQDPGNQTRAGDPLEYTDDGARSGTFPHGDQTYLAHLRPPTPPAGKLQALH